ncbi:MAG: PIN domain-containing protein [Prevotella sp.]|nr:PIN domain-containing protein [Prevotella sp.]
MNGYLLDTSICVYLFRNKFNIADKLDRIGRENCFISSVTIAELVYGAYKSNSPTENLNMIRTFCNTVNIVPFEEAIDIYAQEKNRLRKEGLIIEDFDLLIASAANVRNLILVTDNTKHLGRINDIKLENWAER